MITPLLRRGPPPATEIARVRHRLSCGETIEAIATDLRRNPATLSRYLGRPELHPLETSKALMVTLPSGAQITGLSFRELARLARSL